MPSAAPNGSHARRGSRGRTHPDFQQPIEALVVAATGLSSISPHPDPGCVPPSTCLRCGDVKRKSVEPVIAGLRRRASEGRYPRRRGRARRWNPSIQRSRGQEKAATSPRRGSLSNRCLPSQLSCVKQPTSSGPARVRATGLEHSSFRCKKRIREGRVETRPRLAVIQPLDRFRTLPRPSDSFDRLDDVRRRVKSSLRTAARRP
jgi:hypothetical protein